MLVSKRSLPNVLGVALLAMLAAGFLGYRLTAQAAVDARSEAVHAELRARCESCHSDAGHRRFFDEWEPDAHEHAFGSAYTPGRLLPARFDERRYRSRYLSYLSGLAQTQGKRELAAELRRLQAEMDG